MSGLTITPILQSGVYAPLAAFIQLVTGLGAEQVVQGIPNRASMPTPGFISYQTIFRHRLATNLHTYDQVDPNPTTASILESIELTVQIDCYGPQSTDEIEGPEDWANILSATLRDEYGVTNLGPTLTPLYADDAQMIPLVNAEDQYEERWMVTARFEFDPTTVIPQEYANVLKIKLWDVPLQAPY